MPVYNPFLCLPLSSINMHVYIHVRRYVFKLSIMVALINMKQSVHMNIVNLYVYLRIYTWIYITNNKHLRRAYEFEYLYIHTYIHTYIRMHNVCIHAQA
jgi:hypothetical protein